MKEKISLCLANLSKLLMNADFIQALEAANTPESVQAVVNLAAAGLETKKASESQQTPIPTDSDEPYLIAVTACPTGIAHTYMAEEALINKAKEMGIQIKVETDGSEGVKNHLTSEDIEKVLDVCYEGDYSQLISTLTTHMTMEESGE